MRRLGLIMTVALINGAGMAATHARPSPDPSQPAYRQGYADRLAWEKWFEQQVGAAQSGASFWAAQRNLRHPQSCESYVGSEQDANAALKDGHAGLADALDGCRTARRLLDPVDARRKSEPQYWFGWNSYDPNRVIPDSANPSESTPRPDAPPSDQPPAKEAQADPGSGVTILDTPHIQQTPPSPAMSDGPGLPSWVLVLLGAAIIFAFFARGARGGNSESRPGNYSGVLLGIMGSFFGVLGILTIGPIFVPLAAICGIIGLIGSISGGSFVGLLFSIIACSLTVAGFIFSPSLWLLTGAAALAISHH